MKLDVSGRSGFCSFFQIAIKNKKVYPYPIQKLISDQIKIKSFVFPNPKFRVSVMQNEYSAYFSVEKKESSL
jgi:hypothetical protein